MLYDDSIFTLYFGNKQTAVYKQKNTYDLSPLISLKNTFGTSFIFANQVHGTSGIHIARRDQQTLIPFTYNADFLYTNDSSVALGVLTADCVPVVLCDYKNKAYVVVHAGWRGAHAGIVPKALETLHKTYNTELSNVRIFVGPSARACCYEVDQPFYDLVSADSVAKDCFSSRNGQLFFDVAGYIQKQIMAYGVPEVAMNTSYNVCTMCVPDFCSYRRGTPAGGRNVTLVSLRTSTVLP